MKLKIYKEHEINLNEKNMREITISTLRRLVAPSEYIRNIKGELWLMQDDPNWRHGSLSEVKVREATDLDLAVYKILEYLNE